MDKKNRQGLDKKESRLSGKRKKPTFAILSKTARDIGQDISKRTQNMSHICVDEDKKIKEKAKNIGSEIVSLYDDGAFSLSNNLKHITFKELVTDTFYGIGKFSKKSWDTLGGILDDLWE